jgi:hypothetical protein
MHDMTTARREWAAPYTVSRKTLTQILSDRGDLLPVGIGLHNLSLVLSSYTKGPYGFGGAIKACWCISDFFNPVIVL